MEAQSLFEMAEKTAFTVSFKDMLIVPIHIGTAENYAYYLSRDEIYLYDGITFIDANQNFEHILALLNYRGQSKHPDQILKIRRKLTDGSELIHNLVKFCAFFREEMYALAAQYISPDHQPHYAQLYGSVLYVGYKYPERVVGRRGWRIAPFVETLLSCGKQLEILY